MRQYADHRLLWLLAAGGILAACYKLRNVLLLNPLPLALSDGDDLDIDSIPAPRRPRCDENAINLSTLNTLAFGPTFELRELSRKIIFDRFLASSSTQLLAKDLSSPSATERNKAVNAIWLLFSTEDTRSDTIALFLIPNVSAVVEALVNILPEHERHAARQPSIDALPSSPVKPAYRPRVETKLLQIVYGILNFNPDYTGKTEAIKAGVISRWLAKYPFPCSQENYANYTRSDVVSLLTSSITEWSSDDEDMANIIRSLLSSTEAEEEFFTYGLDERNRRPHRDAILSRRGRLSRRGGLNYSRHTEFRRHRDQSPSPESSSSVSSYNSADEFLEFMHGPGLVRINPLEEFDLPADWEIQGPRTRPRDAPERSREEEQLRRRHREAVVVAERGVPLGPENILERRDTEPEVGERANDSEQTEPEAGPEPIPAEIMQPSGLRAL